jgi:hypothetical protein
VAEIPQKFKPVQKHVLPTIIKSKKSPKAIWYAQTKNWIFAKTPQSPQATPALSVYPFGNSPRDFVLLTG